MPEDVAPAVGMIELSRFDQLGGRAMSYPIVVFDKAAMRRELGELVERMVEDIPSALLEEEAHDLIGAGRYERIAGREASRAGHYECGLTATSGQVMLRMPKLKGVGFAAAIIKRCRRRAPQVRGR